MRRSCLVAVMCFSALLATGLPAASPPVVELDPGFNEVLVSVVNNSGRQLKALRISVNRETLPRWLEVVETPGTIDLPQGRSSLHKLALGIQVKGPLQGMNDPVEGASPVLPLVLTDSEGGRWEFEVMVKVKAAANLPASSELFQNYPNPFNPQITIRYAIASREALPTKLVIFNSLGQRVKTLVDGPQGAGFYSATWDGRDELGRRVASGVYLCKLTSGHFVRTSRMLLVQ
ncbi:MAG TPA: T9SS type A sorting domain-containing protein [Candidatus Latescibacteria bacterium]|nr:T9SS type A sorting domain-containing protein [Candidatus Latescibacterota bacterium]